MPPLETQIADVTATVELTDRVEPRYHWTLWNGDDVDDEGRLRLALDRHPNSTEAMASLLDRLKDAAADETQQFMGETSLWARRNYDAIVAAEAGLRSGIDLCP